MWVQPLGPPGQRETLSELQCKGHGTEEALKHGGAARTQGFPGH